MEQRGSAAPSLAEDRTKISARGLHYRELNQCIRQYIDQGTQEIEIDGVNGQRYIGGGIKASRLSISILGVPGNDLASFMEGPEIEVWGNVQDGVGNTMSAGRVAIHGQAGDILGHSMRGGRIYVRGDAGYRIGIHMKAYQDQFPVIVIGGRAGDFLGEYMAGGMIIVLGLDVLGLDVAKVSGPVAPAVSKGAAAGQPPVPAPAWLPGSVWNWRHRSIAGNYVGTGMHGGVIYLRGEVEPHQLGKEVKAVRLELGGPGQRVMAGAGSGGVRLGPGELSSDREVLQRYLEDFCSRLCPELTAEELLAGTWTKLVPTTSRPYGRLYAY